MENWIKVFEDGMQVRAEIVKGILIENEIQAVVLNKKETVYQIFGTYEVLVNRDDAMNATKLIQNALTF
jgi:Zn-dependent metalloprotease